MSDAFITGGSGFLGYHLRHRLEEDGISYTVYDRRAGCDVLNYAQLLEAMQAAQPTIVYHLAALADVRDSLPQARDQCDQNLRATLNVLEAMQAAKVGRIVFTSSAVVYGDTDRGRIGETAPMPRQTSVYGAMKLASEGLIEAYCHGYGMRADIFRLVSVVGEAYRHGNLYDFYRKLKADPKAIHLLGTGREQKYYTYAGDVVDAMQRAANQVHDGAEVWNVSGAQPVRIDDVLDAVCAELHVSPARTYQSKTWAGDLPGLVLDTTKLQRIGWQPTVSIVEGLRRTVRWFQEAGL